jgi:hypothetical protein
MKHKIINASLLLMFSIFCLAPGLAHSAAAFAMPGDRGYFGTIELDTQLSRETLHCRYIAYQNGDKLLEARVGQGIGSRFFQKLTVEPSHHELYNGDDRLFMVAHGMLRVVIDAFRAAYSGDSDAMEEGKSVKITKITDSFNNDFLLILTTDLIDPQHIKFSIQSAGNSEITGALDGRPVDPLPNTYDVRHWHHRLPRVIKTLFDARSLNIVQNSPE